LRWRAYFRAGAVASALVWGSTALVLYPPESVAHQIFIAFALGGMVAGSMTVLAPVFSVFAMFALVALVPIIVRLTLSSDDIHYAMAGMGTVFLFAMLAVGKRIHATITLSLRLRFVNQDLIAYLRHEKQHVESVNMELRAVQEELKRSNEVLERRVRERTAALEDVAITHERLATRDPLTGLGNRRLLANRIAAALANARRNKSIVALVYIDLDEFKQINDTLGHSVGDALLKSVGRRLESVVREEDTVARVGGDEFMIALWQVANLSDAGNVATKLVEIVSQPYVVEEHNVSVTISAGVSMYPGNGEDADSLMKDADTALYEAKRAGKNTFRISPQTASPGRARD
jgi:diguanylate cyclase (GGDEF)-like protein